MFCLQFHVLKLDGVDGLCDLHCLCGVLEVLQDRPHSKYGYAMLRPPCVAQPDFWVSKVLGFKAITHRFRTWVFEECQNDPVFNFWVPRARWEFFPRIVSLLFIYLYIYIYIVSLLHVHIAHRVGRFFRFGGPLKNLSLTKTQPFGSDEIDPIQKYREIFLASQKIKQKKPTRTVENV